MIIIDFWIGSISSRKPCGFQNDGLRQLPATACWAPREVFVMLVFVSLLPMLGSCTPTTAVIGAGARTGLVLAEDRPVKEIWRDSRLKIAINRELLATSFSDTYWSLNTTIFEGRVLLTGRVKTVDLRDQVNQIAWSIEGVREVLNEIEVAQLTDMSQIARDTLIETALKAKMLSDPIISDINYKIAAHNNVLYVIGIARDQVELKAVVRHAREVSYVRKFVNYVQLANNPGRAR